MAIALPVVKANADVPAVSAAAAVADEVVVPYVVTDRPGARPLALAASRQLAGLISEMHPTWVNVMLSQGTILDGMAKFQLLENIKAGRDEENAKLTDLQTELLAVWLRLVAHDNSQAGTVLARAADMSGPGRSAGIGAWPRRFTRA